MKEKSRLIFNLLESYAIANVLGQATVMLTSQRKRPFVLLKTY